MAEDAPALASPSVADPEAAELPAPSSPQETEETEPSLKRRQSDVSDSEPKRRRLSQNDSTAPPAGPDTNTLQDERRKTRQLEERKRGQRLFGALLGTLSQGSSIPASKLRADIERRQQAKLKQQDEEDSQRRKQRLEDLKAIRRKEQRKRDEKAMKIRHANLLHFANFFRTKTEPRLFYKPWQLTPDQEDQIKYQIEEAKATIEREVSEFEKRKAQYEEEERNAADKEEQVANSSREDPDRAEDEEAANSMAQDNTDENPAHGVAPDDATSVPSSTTAVNESMEEVKDTVDDDQGETVEEADEDTVIY
ncbi:uncharacterized protein PV09_06295 [Verruconis gallopava]|uniref:Pinin/SDK/MemA protein domain-containing protein n=1 Tax=Verruconis gallopava TaxID=253628 RepID=A0A0D2A6Z3_9PEZI|nr:uncharacterized protein PV09_06295 [Verruconis gallopava]KIW02493.1 hypothetical protein PV09_06295 [Verruconis gallopava]